MKILFITPTAGHTGSEMFLWYLLDKVKGKVQTALYARKKGSLLENKVPANEVFYHDSKQNFFYKFYESLYYKIFKNIPEIAKIKQVQSKIKADFWYLNTIMHPDVAKLAVSLNIPYIVHLHELEGVYEEIKEKDLGFLLKNAHTIVCCASKVQQRVTQMGYQNTFLMYEVIDSSKITISQQPAALREKLNIPSDAYIWLMSGTMTLRKGYDMIPDILENLPKNHYFVWLGSKKEAGTLHYIKQRVKNEKLNFIDVGSKTDDYYDYLNLADGFVLLSREDPFPLVMIEAAYLGKPIAAFNSGGVSEFVLEGMGKVVDSFNPKELANEMIKIANGETKTNPIISKNRGSEFDVSQQAPKWIEFMNALK